MGREYAGILGPIAFFIVIVRGVLDAGGAIATLQTACVCLFVFAALGAAAGRLAAWIVEESVHRRLKTEMPETEPPAGEPAATT